jgi:hypothetical protein
MTWRTEAGSHRASGHRIENAPLSEYQLRIDTYYEGERDLDLDIEELILFLTPGCDQMTAEADGTPMTRWPKKKP